MTKEELVDLVRKILNTEADLDFLPDLGQRELETLIACIRDRIEQEKRKANSSKINQPCFRLFGARMQAE